MAAGAGEWALPRLAGRALGHGARVHARPALKLLLGRADRVWIGPVVARDVRARWRHGGFTIHGTVPVAALGRVLPPQLALRAAGPALELTASAFGFTTTLRADLEARDGAVVLVPRGPLAGIGPVPVFRDRRLAVTAIDVHAAGADLRVRLLATRRTRRAAPTAPAASPSGAASA